MQSKDLSISSDEWIRLLLRSEIGCSVNLAGFPGYHIFEEGLQMRVMGLTEHLLHFVAEGTMLVSTESGEFSVTAGSLCMLSPGVVAEYASQNMRPLGVYRFRIRASAGGQCVRYAQDFLIADEAWHLQSAVEEVLRQSESEEQLAKHSVHGALAMIFSNLFQRERKEKQGSPGLTPSQSRRVREYYHKMYKTWPTPADLAAHVDLSLDYFARLFKVSFGVSPRKWLVEERIRLSRILVTQSTDSIEAIAKRLGYADYRLFIRQFKDCSGCTPTTYRKLGPSAAVLLNRAASEH